MSNPAPTTRLSKSSLFSLIFGILGCIPFVTGAFAMLLGLIGFFRAGKPGVRGRWMAVVGGLLGTASVVIWSLFFGTLMAGIFAVMGMTQPVRVATHDFIRDLSVMSMADLKSHHSQFADDSLERLQTIVQKQGAFVDTTFPNSSIDNDTGHVEGVAKFAGGTLNVKADLEKEGNDWKVMKIDLSP